MYKQPSSKRYLAQWGSQDKDFSILRSEDQWGPQMKPLASAMNPWSSLLFQEPQSNLIINKNMDRYVEAQSQFGKRDRQEWSKHENSYRENKSVLLAVPIDPDISRMSSLLPDKKSNCSSSSPRKSVATNWTNSGRCGSFRGMEREIKARFSEDQSNKGDLDMPDIPYYHPCDYARKSKIQAHSLFELIKTQCLGNPMLMKKVVEWGINHAESSQITGKEIRELSRGRYWITARSVLPDGNTPVPSFKEDVDNLQGAYQEFDKGVFQQLLIPQGREAAIQHRVYKYKSDRWGIDKWEAGVWRPVAREKLDKSWVDLRYNRPIYVKVIPLLMILRRLEEKFQAHQKIDKCVEFLFTSFDRKKLNGKLKTRNLKHNIANLKLKLEKQYALNFAINVATTADCISIDDQRCLYPGGEF